jgi:hypothetical protein
MIAFAQYQLSMGNVQLTVKIGASCVLHAMIGPKDLLAIANIDGLKVLLAMRGRERLMIAWVPILREHHMLKCFRNPID